MPLTEGDIEVLAIIRASGKLPNGSMVEGKEIRFRVRGETECALFVPEAEFSKPYVEQLLIKAASEIIDLHDRFPIKG